MSNTLTTTATTAERRAQLEHQLRTLDVFEQVIADNDLNVDPMPPWGTEWIYVESDAMQTADDDTRRRAALAWLARHAKAVTLIARALGHDGPVKKVANESVFGVEQFVVVGSRGVSLRAVVPADTTCEMVDTGEVEHVPAHERPVFERKCPESIFAGIEREVSA